MNPDGKMWQSFANSGSQGTFIKAAYVQGAIEGLRTGSAIGYSDGRLDEATDVLNDFKQCAADKNHSCGDIPASLTKPEALPNAVMAGLDKEQGKVMPHHSSILDIVRQMDKFYNDYRNTPVCMIVALQESIQSLQGKASTEAELRLMREQGCNH
jgi:hypothetical protein